MKRAVSLAGVVGAVVMTAPASASTVKLQTDPVTGLKALHYAGAPGEVNLLSGYNYGDVIQVQDGVGDSSIVIAPEAPCVSGQPRVSGPIRPHFAGCPASGVRLVTVDLGDEDDKFAAVHNHLGVPTRAFGGDGADRLSGGRHDDVLLGGEGPDRLQGESGDDVLDGGPGPDQIEGDESGAGAAPGGWDLLDYSDRTAGVSVTLDGRSNDGEDGEGDDVAGDIEDSKGGSGDDFIRTNERVNQLYGGDGDDTLDAGAGADLLVGGDGNDTLAARDGEVDEVRCGAGDDTVQADAADTVAPDCETVQLPPAVVSAPTAHTLPDAERTPLAISVTVLPSQSLKRGVRLDVRCSDACRLKADLASAGPPPVRSASRGASAAARPRARPPAARRCG